MTNPLQAAAAPAPKQDPETLVLRGRPRPAVRFRRGLIAGASAIVAAALITISWLALAPPRAPTAAPLAASDEQPARPPEALAELPSNYGEVPRLGPPLPGDLGRAILAHQRSLSGEAAAGDSALSAEESPERAEGAREAARTASLMVALAGRPSAGESAPGANGAPAQAEPPQQGAQAAALPSGGQQEIAAPGSDELQGEPRRTSDQQAMVLSAGTVIPAALLTGLDSDLPGMVIAQVTENVRDSASGRWILVPQGARLVGKYDSRVGYGQRRALLVWTRIVFPDGSSVALDQVPATDAAGYSGLSDRVDPHSSQLLAGIAMATLLGVGTELGLGQGGSGLVRAIREAASDNAAHAGNQITARNLAVAPTIAVRPGWPVRALLGKDLVLAPWKG